MNQVYSKYKLVVWLGSLLLVGFVTISMVAYITSREALRRNMAEQIFPLANDSLYSEIQRNLVRPVIMAGNMAEDIFLRDWLQRGEKNTDKMQRYLELISLKNEVGLLFLVSDQTRNYYTPSGVAGVVNQADPEDQWYFRFRDSDKSLETLVDNDSVGNTGSLIYYNHRIVDGKGLFLGVTGIGIPIDIINQIILRFSNENYTRFSHKLNNELGKNWLEKWWLRNNGKSPGESDGTKAGAKTGTTTGAAVLSGVHADRVKSPDTPFISQSAAYAQTEKLAHSNKLLSGMDHHDNAITRAIYFVDTQGRIVLSSGKYAVNTLIRSLPGFDEVAHKILNTTNGTSKECYSGIVELNGFPAMMNVRFLPELGWYLIVEENIADKLTSIQHVFVFNLMVSGVVSLMVLLLSIYSINHQQNHLIYMATTDGLTGLMNRHSFDITFQQALREMQRSNQPLSLILYDIDFFKKINDVHGHLIGDRVITEITALSKEVVRGSDLLCRWGGEEFIILLKNCGLAQAVNIAEQLRKNIMNHDFAFIKEKTTVTVSMGVAECAEHETQDQLFVRVDNAMYRAMKEGRNRIVISEKEDTID